MVNPRIDIDERNDLDTMSDDELDAYEARTEPVTEAEYAAAMACPCRAPNACNRCDAVMVRLLDGAVVGGGLAA